MHVSPAVWRHVQTRQSNKPVFVPFDLRSCSHVFLRHDAVRRPLQPIYDGSFRVVHRGEKTFTITKGGKEDPVSINHLKPAYLENDDNIHQFNRPKQEKRPDWDMSSSPSPTAVPTRDGHPRTTRSGHHGKLPEGLQVSEIYRPSVPSRLGGGWRHVTPRCHNTFHPTLPRGPKSIHCSYLNKVTGVYRHNPVGGEKVRFSLGPSKESTTPSSNLYILLQVYAPPMHQVWTECAPQPPMLLVYKGPLHGLSDVALRPFVVFFSFNAASNIGSQLLLASPGSAKASNQCLGVSNVFLSVAYVLIWLLTIVTWFGSIQTVYCTRFDLFGTLSARPKHD